MKKLDNLLSVIGISIVKNDTFHHGRFSVVELTDSKGNHAVGVSRCSDLDKTNSIQGVSIARGRAERALYQKLMHKNIRHPLMG